MRRRFALAVIALHCLLLWLLAVGFRIREEPAPPAPQLISLYLIPPAPAETEPLIPALPAPPKAITPKRPPVVEPPPLVAPITLPAPLTPAPASPTQTAPAVDWAREATLAARNAGQAIATPKQEPFSGKPKTIPKRCVPKDKSMEWQGQQDRRVGMTGGIPYIKLNDRCVLVAIIPMCVLGKLPEANIHLFDDMQDPNRSRSSVPDPNICD